MDKTVFIASSVHRWNDTRIFHKEALSLAKKYDVELHAIGDFRHKEIDNVRVFCLPATKRFMRPLNWIRLFWRVLKSPCAVFHFHDPELLPLGLKIKLLTKKKVIYDVHECYGETILTRTWIPRFARLFVSSTFDRFEKSAAKHLDLIIAATDTIAGRFGSGKSAVIKNYPSPGNAPYPIPGQRKRNGNNNLIYIGSMNRVRGIHELVKSLKFIDGKFRVKLKLMGSFDNENFKNTIEHMDEFKDVELMSWSAQTEVRDELLKARIGIVCCHPTKNYITSLPLKMFEYMSAGLPVIASNFPLWKEIVEGNNCGLTVNPLDPREIANAVEYLLQRQELMERMGENGRKAINEKYNWAAQEKKLLEIYDNLVK